MKLVKAVLFITLFGALSAAHAEGVSCGAVTDTNRDLSPAQQHAEVNNKWNQSNGKQPAQKQEVKPAASSSNSFS